MKKNSLSFFYNHTKQQKIECNCDSMNYLQWLVSNINKFNFPEPQKVIELYEQKNEKLLKYEILKENISYVEYNSSYTKIISLNIDNGKEILDIINKLILPKEVFISLEDIHAIFLDKKQLQHYFYTGEISSKCVESYIESNKQINKMIEELKSFSFSDNMYVFGSTTRGKRCPQDVDIWIDYINGDISLNDKEKIIRIVKQYSYRLDCYMKINEEIWGLNIDVFQDECEWINLSIFDPEAVKNWEKNRESFLPLNQLKDFPTHTDDILGRKYVKKYKY